MSIRRDDVIMTLSKMPFFVSKLNNAKSVSVNNFNKFKRIFMTFDRQH